MALKLLAAVKKGFYIYVTLQFTEKEYAVIRSRKGNHLILYHGFTYAKKTTYFWQCSSNSVKVRCPAKVRLEEGNIIRELSNFNHVHEPPKYVKCGHDYVRIT